MARWRTGNLEKCRVHADLEWIDIPLDAALPPRNFTMTDALAASSVRDDKARSRFELDVDGSVAFADYKLAGDRVIITHTETPPSLRGRGIASQLVEGALGLIRADGYKVVAGCSYVVDYLERHPEYADLMG
jgi:predicted GNAT family acetyltransferase